MMKHTNTYKDLFDKEITLTDSEINYFRGIAIEIKNKLNYTGEILNSDFEEFADKNVKNYAVGICFKNDTDYRIFIDNYFIHECYESLTKSYMKLLLDGKTIESVICHEIAHLTHWNHGKKHKELTNKYLIAGQGSRR